MEWIALAICTASSASLLATVLVHCRFGFDFTDEGFYLNWISDPWRYPASVTQFGFVYHPLYQLLGGDVTLLRQSSVLIIFVLSFTLYWVWLCSHRLDGSAVGPSQRIGLAGAAVALASASLAFFELWLPTPSYNSLAFQSLIVTGIGALLADRNLSMRSIAGWTLIGIGGALAFLAKPTTAAMLGCLVAGYIPIAGKFTLRGLLFSLAIAVLLLIAAALAIDGSISGFVRRCSDGLDMTRLLMADSRSANVFRWDHLEISRRQMAGSVLVMIVTCVLMLPDFLSRNWPRLGAGAIALLLAVLSVALVTGILSAGAMHDVFHPLQLGAAAVGALLAMTASPAHPFRKVSRGDLALIIFFALLPCAYAIGTNSNIWNAASRAALFWTFAGVATYLKDAAHDGNWRKLVPVAAVSLLVSTAIVATAMDNPYRQTRPLRQQGVATAINHVGANLFLSENAASYVAHLGRLAHDNGLRSGDPVLDLTGVSPGAIYAIGARSPGVAWTLGGYPGSNDFLTAALRRETCASIGTSWILTEPDSPDSLPPDLLQQFGIELSRDYRDVGSIRSTRSFAPTSFEQRLHMPIRYPEAAQQACEQAKLAGSSRSR